MDERRKTRRGIAAGVLCYVLWGCIPIYWKLLGNVDSFEIVAHRLIWCFVFCALVCLVMGRKWTHLLRDRRAMRFLVPAALIITANWSIFIFAVNMGRIIETSIGYYINPLVTIALGLIVFKERLSPVEWIAIGLMCVGIGYFAMGYGQFPWISVLLAVTFGVYGAIKKKAGYPAIEAIAVEGLVMLPVALAGAVILAIVTGSHGFMGELSFEGWQTTLLLLGGGVVTAVPLILFAAAANSIPLTIIGFLQFFSPTLSLLIGVFLYGEPFTMAHGVCLGLIWTGLALVMANSVRKARKAPKQA